MSVAALIHKYAPAFWAIFLAIFFNAILTVEWSSPYCNNAEDGAAYAAFGFPLPYTKFGGYSSLEYLFMPTAYCVNLGVLFIVFFLFARRLLSFTSRHSPKLSKASSYLAIFLAIAIVSIELLKAGTIYAVSVQSIGDNYSAYFSYRPVGISTGTHYDCIASEFWFGEISQ